MSEVVLITGGTGFLGYHLITKLVELNYTVLAYKRSSSSTEKFGSFNEKIHWYNISELDEPFKKYQKINHVVHLATCYGRDNELLSHILETNLMLPIRLLELAIRFNAETFFNADTLLAGHISQYSKSKSQLEEWLSNLSFQRKIDELKVINLKIEHMYGPMDSDQKFLHYVLKRCLENRSIPLTDGLHTRDFIYIDDVVDAIVFLMKNLLKLSLGLHSFELGTGVSTSIRDLVTMIHEITQSRSELLFGALTKREGEQQHLFADITLLNELGWYPKYTLLEGLKKMHELEVANR